MSGDTIYRVRVRTALSLRPGGGTNWQDEVLYCGTDRAEARTAYHGSTPDDYPGSPGNRCRETLFEAIEDAETGDAADDPVVACEDAD